MPSCAKGFFSTCDAIKFLVQTLQGSVHLVVVGLLYSSLAPDDGDSELQVASVPYLIYTTALLLFLRDAFLWMSGHNSYMLDYPLALILGISLLVLVWGLVHPTEGEARLLDHGTSFKYTVVSTIFLFLMALMQILEGLWHKSTHYVFHTALVPANDEKKGDGSGGSGRGKVSAQAGHRGYVEMR